jgi:NADH:ubiquinone oxidoreductase subunit 5 (subunit L)/multisubunit Na+/H+ antiporter MnhA subunit
MEAPVPISAQLHSSTLVIIGLYLLFRFSNLLSLSSCIQHFMLVTSTFSIVNFSVLAFFQFDGKKLLACSTASQLGYVIATFSLNLFNESLLMLTFCSCNKALTFI